MSAILLNNIQINQKIDRLAYQILENTFEENQLFICGITGNGILLANQIAEIMKPEFEKPIEVFEIKLNKENPLEGTIELNFDLNRTINCCIILVDDVINSGKTMQYALMELLKKNVRSVKTVALVDREHRRYPIKCDFVGLTLSTTLQERVEITMDSSKEAFLV